MQQTSTSYIDTNTCMDVYIHLMYIHSIIFDLEGGGCAAVLSFVVAAGAVVVGNYLGLDYSAKLFVITFLLIIMGVEHPAGAHQDVSIKTVFLA